MTFLFLFNNVYRSLIGRLFVSRSLVGLLLIGFRKCILVGLLAFGSGVVTFNVGVFASAAFFAFVLHLVFACSVLVALQRRLLRPLRLRQQASSPSVRLASSPSTSTSAC